MDRQQEFAAWIENWIRKELRPAAVAHDKQFVTFGMDSVHAMMLVGDLEEHLSVRLAPTLAWDHPTIEALAAYLATLTPGEAASDGDNLDSLSDEELDRLLAEEMARRN